MRIIVSDSHKDITYETLNNFLAESITLEKIDDKYPEINIVFESITDFDTKRAGGVYIPVLEYKEDTVFYYTIVEERPHFVGHIALNPQFFGDSITIHFFLEEK